LRTISRQTASASINRRALTVSVPAM
jgi:hypothetical protein